MQLVCLFGTSTLASSFCPSGFLLQESHQKSVGSSSVFPLVQYYHCAYKNVVYLSYLHLERDN